MTSEWRSDPLRSILYLLRTRCKEFDKAITSQMQMHISFLGTILVCSSPVLCQHLTIRSNYRDARTHALTHEHARGCAHSCAQQSCLRVCARTHGTRRDFSVVFVANSMPMFQILSYDQNLHACTRTCTRLFFPNAHSRSYSIFLSFLTFCLCFSKNALITCRCGLMASNIPAALFALFQMMFATITPLLMTGVLSPLLHTRNAA